MNKKETDAAYKAIDKFVHTCLSNRNMLHIEDDMRTKCHDYFDAHKDAYDKARKASIETFACRLADTCLFNEMRGLARQKRREKVAHFRMGLAVGEVRSQERLRRLVAEALKLLSPNQAEILKCIMRNEPLEAYAERNHIAPRTMDRRVAAAKKAFAKAYQKIINERN